MNKNKFIKQFRTRYMKLGGYGVILSAIVLAIALAANLLINSLPASLTKYDTTSFGLYNVSKESENLLGSITDDVTVYLIAESKMEDTVIKELVGRYSSINGKIKLKTVDPAIQPTFVSQYTDEELSSNSIIVVNNDNGRVKCVDYNEIYEISYTDEEIYNYYYYGIESTGTTSFAGEREITSAIDYVTAETLPKIYVVSGHGETAIGDTLKQYIKSENIQTESIDFTSITKIPADANIVLINLPTSDISASDAEILKNYAELGGCVILVTEFTGTEPDKFENLNVLCGEYGLIRQEGLLVEGSANHYASNVPYYVIPNFSQNSTSATITSKLPENSPVILRYAHGILASEEVEGSSFNVIPLLSSSSSAYIKVNVNENSTAAKEEGDIEGTFLYGAIGEKITSAEKNGKLVWFSSADIISEDLAAYANIDYFMSLVTNLCEKEASVAIATKPMQVEALNVNESGANIWGTILIVLIPAVILIYGFTVWYGRRKR